MKILQVDFQTENFLKNVQFFNFHKHNNKSELPPPTPKRCLPSTSLSPSFPLIFPSSLKASISTISRPPSRLSLRVPSRLFSTPPRSKRSRRVRRVSRPPLLPRPRLSAAHPPPRKPMRFLPPTKARWSSSRPSILTRV